MSRYSWQTIGATQSLPVPTAELKRFSPKTLLWVAILAVAYCVTAWSWVQVDAQQAYAASIWPAPALAFAAALWWQRRAWPGIWIGFFLLNLAIAAPQSGITASGAIVAASVALGATAQAVLGAILIRRWLPAGDLFARPASVFTFAGVAALSGLLAPTWTAITVLLGGLTNTRSSLAQWPAHWLGNLTSALVFAPLLLQWRELLRVSRRKRWILEAIVTCLVIVGISGVVFFDWQAIGSPQYPLAFVALPLVIWIAFRFRPPGVALTSAFVCAMALFAMSRHSGRFARDISPELLLLFQAFGGLVSVTGLALAAAITAHKQAEKALRAEKAGYIDLYENAPDMFASVDAATATITECNQTFATVLGRPKSALIGSPVFDLYHQDSQDAARTAFAAFQKTGQMHGAELQLQRANGSKIDVSLTASAVRDAEGSIVSSRSAWRDITARKLAERALGESQELWRVFIEQAPAAIAMFDRQMHYLAVSRRFLSDSGFPPELELYGQSHYAVFPTMPAHWKAAHQRALAGEVVTADEDRFETGDGRVQWLRWEVRPWYDVSGLGGVVVFTEDISNRKQATDELRKLNSELEERVRERTTQLEQLAREMEAQSLTDQLTGLPNRRALDHKLAVEVRLALRHQVPLSLLLLDVDNFKQYNDSFGHLAGDEVLRALGRSLQVHTRTTDFAARWGGEEFAVLLRHTDEDGARVVAERIREAVETATWTNRPVTVSVGAATLWQPAADDVALLAAADQALYEAKRGGRNRVAGAREPAAHADNGQHKKSA
jgi:diguanylate cyclase (GGDEF)-like protein/PAS domain S-box-containing protein